MKSPNHRKSQFTKKSLTPLSQIKKSLMRLKRESEKIIKMQNLGVKVCL